MDRHLPVYLIERMGGLVGLHEALQSQDGARHLVAATDNRDRPELIPLCWSLGASEAVQATVIREVWIHDHRLMLNMYKARGTRMLLESSQMHSGEPEWPALQSKTVKVYRGCHPRDLNGLSWTTDRNCAHFFAERHLDPMTRNFGLVYEASVLRSTVRFWTNERRESEVVLRVRVPGNAVATPADPALADQYRDANRPKAARAHAEVTTV